LLKSKRGIPTAAKSASYPNVSWPLSQAVVRAAKGFEASPSDMWSLVGGGLIGRIEGGPRLRSPKKTARWLTIDTRAGGWAEVGARDADVDQHVVATHEAAATLAKVDGVEPRGSTPSGGAVYFVPKGVVIDDLATAPREHQPRFRGGLPLRAATRSYLLSPHGAPEVVLAGGLDDAQDYAVDTVPVEGLCLGPGDHVVEAGGHDLRLRLVDRILAPGERHDGDSWYDDLPEPVGIQVPHIAGTVWVIGPDGAAEERDVPRPRWLDGMGLFPTAADVSAIVRSTQFEPLYVVSRPSEGRVWVTRVPDGLRVADPTAARRSYDRLTARKLVAHLLVDTRPGHIADDRTWKKSLAALMREAHR
jgi:hypothetical protein